MLVIVMFVIVVLVVLVIVVLVMCMATAHGGHGHGECFEVFGSKFENIFAFLKVVNGHGGAGGAFAASG